MDRDDDESALRDLLREAKSLAIRYYALTGKPLGVTGEVAEYEAAEKLGLSLAAVRTPFFDAISSVGDQPERFQIKGRAVASTDRYRGRTPTIECGGEFDAVLLVLLDRATFEALEIWRAEREAVAARLAAPGSKSRNERKSMNITQFKSIPGASCVWRAE